MYLEVYSYENLGNLEIVYWAIIAEYMCCWGGKHLHVSHQKSIM